MKKIFFTLAAIICCKVTFAQISIERQVFGTSGNITNTGLIQASSSIGEPLILTHTQSTLVVTQGFEQPDTIAASGINSPNISIANVSAYPNPTMNTVVLDFKITQPLECIIDVYNDLGQTIGIPLQTKIYNNCTQELNFSEFASGNYLIVIKSIDGILQKSFKVQKVN